MNNIGFQYSIQRTEDLPEQMTILLATFRVIKNDI